MNKIILTNQTVDGIPLQAAYLPAQGLNMVSFKRGDLEVIDPSTEALFQERYAGLGALIGPHFHHRKTEILPVIKDESLFPHLSRIKAKGIKEPFSHGIARYAPWNVECTENTLHGVLTGSDLWNGVPLSELEGQNFKLLYTARLLPDGLHIEYSVVSDFDSLVGLHYYYHLPEGTGCVVSKVQNTYREKGEVKKIPAHWKQEQELKFFLDQEADYTFSPAPNPRIAAIELHTSTHVLKTAYESPSEENCWQLYHPLGASYACIEPLSARDPHHPNLTVSSLAIHLSIYPNASN